MGLVSAYCRSRWYQGMPGDAPRTMEEAITRIDELYDSGKPFFTKESIRSVYEQFQGPTEAGDKILVKDVAGATIEYTLRTGETFMWKLSSDDSGNEEEDELIIQQPILHYHGRGHLKSILRLLYGYEGADYEPAKTSPFRSLQVYHDSEKVITGTKELAKDPTIPSYDTLKLYFEEQIRMWQESEMCRRVVQILESSVSGHGIEKIVAVSLASISNNYEHRSAFQHAFVLTLREWLLARQESICCYAQDPVYNDVDKIVLGEHGIEVIDDPRAWLELDNRSILFSCASNVPVKEIVADIARPAVVIWERVKETDHDVKGEENVTDPCTPRVRAMLAGYEAFEFGADGHFCRTVIYVRRCTS